ncbi:FAD-dependent oxidoreductase [Candidatus Woesearchaeota archaeon]|nr:FAD-dependent oxidoreductase [Candidatus Woesearchaeota archaeon]
MAKKKTKKKIIILGGGLAGLAAADALLATPEDRKKHEVMILEKADFLGGLASSFEYEGRQIPKYYHQVFDHDYTTQKFLKRAGLFSDMAWKRIKMAFCINGRIYNFTDPISLLRFDYLSLYGRIRYGLFGAYVFTIMNPAKIKDSMNAREWLKRYAGREVTDKLFYQLYGRNKFNIPLERISAKQFACRLKAKEAMGLFGYPRKGLQKMIDFLEKDLKDRGCNILLEADTSVIDTKAKKLTLRVKGGAKEGVKEEVKEGVDGGTEGGAVKTLKYDALIITLPVPVLLKLAKGILESYRKRLSKVEYCPALCVAFGTRSHLSGHYWLNMISERTHTLFQHSNLFDGYGYKVNWILRYGGSIEDFKLSDDEIKAAYLGDVHKYFNEQKPKKKPKILWARVFRERYAEPVYDKDFAKYKPDYKTPVDGLYIANTATSYPNIRNMNTALECGIECAGIVRKKLGGKA